ncbi:MAG: DUF72 domain-containing protein [Acidobacteriota bacterium]|nr:DUF72 domain-containing protein [Acidobacteriota bacterium]
MQCFVGCCGWSEARANYFAHFPIVEVQRTFYEPPSVALATKWREAAPVSFQFCVKAWQLITHRISSPTYRRLKTKLSATERDLVGGFQPTEQVRLAWERTADIARALQARVILFQCPASFEPNPENLRHLRTFFSEIDRERFRLAWEPRGQWPLDLVQGICAEYDLVHCVDPFAGESAFRRPVYWRLHGRTGYSYRYSDEELDQLRAMLTEADQESGAPSYVFFNNIWMRDDALRFQARLRPRLI